MGLSLACVTWNQPDEKILIHIHIKALILKMIRFSSLPQCNSLLYQYCCGWGPTDLELEVVSTKTSSGKYK